MKNFTNFSGKAFVLPDDFRVTTNSPEDMMPALESYFDNFTHKLAKPAMTLSMESTGLKHELNHYAIGVAGEVGELLDAIKKHTMYNKPIDMANVIEELGDLEWYLSSIRRVLNISREDTLLANIEKLSKRYSSLSYSNEAASLRADKVEGA